MTRKIPILLVPAALSLLSPFCMAQSPTRTFTDPLALLAVVGETYAANPDTFRLESIAETVNNGDLERDWRKVYRTAIKGPDNLYRIETRSPFGSYIQDSDGKHEWVYLVEAKAYVVRPVPARWPQFAKITAAGNNELNDAWNMRTRLETEARGYKHATMLPDETIVVAGKSYACYVVHATSDDARNAPAKDARWDRTLWIDKSAHVFRKQVERTEGYMLVTKTVHLPFHRDTTTVYPVADFHPQTPLDTFRFAPPTDANEVASLEPDFALPAPATTPPMVGKPAPKIAFPAADGKTVELSSYLGQPVLLDFWATWCGPCLLSMPGLGRIYNEFRDKGLAVVTLDQDSAPEDATEYLARHHDSWTNFHDVGGRARRAFPGEGIPLTVLIDAQGKIAYCALGGDEESLRKAIALVEADGSTTTPPGEAP